jgi:serine/threonine protein kinase
MPGSGHRRRPRGSVGLRLTPEIGSGIRRRIEPGELRRWYLALALGATGTTAVAAALTRHVSSLVALVVCAGLSLPALRALRSGREVGPARRDSRAPPAGAPRPADQALLTPSGPDASAPRAPEAAEPYELLELIGRGQMGEVWRARHRKLGRITAVKTLPGASMLDEDLARFRREAHIIAGLRSPHVVTLYDFGERLDGTLYFAMEMLEGIDLQALVERHGPLPAGRVLRVLRHVCLGLAEAHRAGAVHRDLKPQNVWLCRKGAELDVAKILDFGLAKAPGAGAPSIRKKLTADGLVLGTAAYLAPESLDGSHHVDGRADLYAVGCIGFWLLTGELVFPFEKIVPMMKAHALDPPRRPSEVATQPVPRALDEVLLHLLAKKPDARPQTADDVAAQLASIRAEPRWSDDDARAWWSTHLPGAAPVEP